MDANTRSYATNTKAASDQAIVMDKSRDRVRYLVQRLTGQDAPDVSIYGELSELREDYLRYAEVLNQEAMNAENLLSGLRLELERVQVFLKSTSQLLDENAKSSVAQRERTRFDGDRTGHEHRG